MKRALRHQLLLFVVLFVKFNVISVFYVYLSIRQAVSASRRIVPNGRDVEGAVVFYEGWNFNSGNYLFTTDTK